MSKLRVVLCSKCKGLGYTGNSVCSECDGEGFIEKEKTRKNKKDSLIKKTEL